MKTIAPAAMTAIDAGEAIVTGAVEIYGNGAVPDIIATGTTVELDWLQATFDQTLGVGGPNDQARMGIGYFDQAGVQIGATVWSPMIDPAPPMVFAAQPPLSDATPAGCAIVRTYMEMSRRTGTNNDGYIDQIELKLGGVAVLLNNPGAEQGTVNWTNEAGAIDIRSASPSAASGTYYFTGGTSALSRAYQDYATYSGGAPIRLWGGYGPITLDGAEYQGLGDRTFAQQTSGAIGGVAQGLTLGVSGVDPYAIELLDAGEVKQAPVVLHRLIFASDGKTLLDHSVWDRGKVDTVGSDETIGSEASIMLAVESAARGLGNSGARMRADSDQRLINSSDGYFDHTAYAAEKELYWGGKKPVRTGDAHGGAVAGTSGGTGAGF